MTKKQYKYEVYIAYEIKRHANLITFLIELIDQNNTLIFLKILTMSYFKFSFFF